MQSPVDRTADTACMLVGGGIRMKQPLADETQDPYMRKGMALAQDRTLSDTTPLTECLKRSTGCDGVGAEGWI